MCIKESCNSCCKDTGTQRPLPRQQRKEKRRKYKQGKRRKIATMYVPGRLGDTIKNKTGQKYTFKISETFMGLIKNIRELFS